MYTGQLHLKSFSITSKYAVRFPLWQDLLHYINEEEAKKAAEHHTTPFVMEDFHPHTLRHTFATRCFEAGIDAKVVQMYLGHASIALVRKKWTIDTRSAKQ